MNMTLTASRRRHEDDGVRGASAVEFALLLPFLLMIVFGIIEFGFIFNTQISLTQAVREGVRVEALETGDGVSATEAAFHPMITDTSGLNAGPVTSCDGHDRAEVRATYNYPFIVFPFMDYAFGSSGTMQLSAKAVMRCGG